MCYLICVALQMGATVDYGILLTNHYRALRTHADKKESAREAIRLSLPTILTSGAALSVAGFTVGIISSVFYISSIGTMLARGAIISVSLVLFLLPQLLQWLDRWIVPSYYSE
jgi:predicted RND superfamily exporter protein